MILEKLHKTFSNGRVYLMETEDGYPLEVTDTYLPYYTKNCINEHTNELKSGDLGDRRERWMIGVSCMSGCPIGCLFCFDEDTDILMSDGTIKKIKDIKINDEIVSNVLRKKSTLNSQDYATKYFEKDIVTNVFKRLYTGIMYLIELNNGKILTLTEDHPIAILGGNQVRNKFKNAKDIQLTDTLIGIKGYDKIQQYDESEREIGWLKGFIDGDGVYCKAHDNRKDCFILETNINAFIFNMQFRPIHPKRLLLDNLTQKYKLSEPIGIRNISTMYVKDKVVYNFETSNHTYVANGVVVHNCATGKLKRWRNLSAEEIFEQVKFIIEKNEGYDPKESKEFKINYTRMGEPFLNIENVRKAMQMVDEYLPKVRVHHYISTVGLRGSDFSWIKDNITLQISLHSLEEERRHKLIPISNLMSIEELGQIRTNSELKTTVNMTLVDVEDFDIEVLKKYFDKEHFFIKLSPINENEISKSNDMGSGIIKGQNVV